MTVRILHGDCRDLLRELPDTSVHCCVTSPPYYGLRDYGREGQLGLEATPTVFVENLVEVFRQVRRVLRDDGTLWLNLGDSYAGSGRGGYPGGKSGLEGGTDGQDQSRIAVGSTKAAGMHEQQRQAGAVGRGWVAPTQGFKNKDLIGIPWRVAFALQADGWYLRQDIVWHKPNPMPESVQDRCTKAHEYVFLLTKSAQYHFDAAAIAEPVTASTVARLSQTGLADQTGSDRVPGKTNGRMKAVGSRRNSFARETKESAGEHGQKPQHRPDREHVDYTSTRNKRSVWTIATQPFAEAHFATMAPELAATCIKAGCPVGGTVLDPFGGAGTTGLIADGLQRDAVLIELNDEYIDIARARISADAPLFAEVA